MPGTSGPVVDSHQSSATHHTPLSIFKSDNLGASSSIWKFASFIFSIDDRPEIDASQFVKLTIVSVIGKLTVNP